MQPAVTQRIVRIGIPSVTLQGDDEAAIQASIRQIAVELKLLGVSCLVWLSVPYGHKSKVGMERFPLLVGGYLS